MANDQCFLCEQLEDKDQPLNLINSCRVPASLKPVGTVLQHLANGIRTKLVFHSDASICTDCLSQLCEYDNLMMDLLKFQKKLMQQLQRVLNKEFRTKSNEAYGEDVSDVTMELVVQEEEKNSKFITSDGLEEIEDFEIIEEVPTQDEDKDTDSDFDDDSTDTTPGRPVHECLSCCLEFATKAMWKAHMQSMHKKVYTCTVCGAERRDEEYLQLHMNLHYGKTEKECRYCPKQFTRPVNTLRHMRKHWNIKKYQCEKCGERFAQDNVLYNHRLLHEAEENPMICSICNVTFRTRKTFNHHLRVHQADRPRHQCPHCVKSFTERYTLKMHMKLHYTVIDPTPTPIQEEIVYRELSEDEIVDTNNVEGNTKQTTCLICSSEFDNITDLEFHMKNNHNVI